MKDTEQYPFGETSDDVFPFGETSDNDFPFAETSDDEFPFGRYEGETNPFDSGDKEETNPFGFVMEGYQEVTDNHPEVTSKEVFDLRKAGKLDEAYTKALQLMEQPNLSDWDIKAYGYVLMSLIKRDVERGHDDQISTYVSALRNLQVEDDEVFENSKNKSLRLCDRGYQQIERLVKARRYKEAAPLARDAYKADRSNENMERLYCQILFNVVKEEAQKQKPKARPVRGYVDAYFGLQGKSRAFFDQHIWNHISKLEDEQGDLNVGQYYLATMEEGLPYDAYIGERKERIPNKSQKGSDRWPSMYGKMAKVVLTYLLTCNDTNLLKEVCESIKGHEYRLDDDEKWVITWNRAKVWMAHKEYAEARKCVLAMIEQKDKEYWTWSALGDTYLVEDESLAASAYCKALLCKLPVKYGAPLKLKLARLLVKENFVTEASIEVAEVIANQKEIGKKSYEEAVKLSQSPWYVADVAGQGNQAFYRGHKNKILTHLYDSVEWNTGMMLGTFTHNTRKFYKIAFDLEDGKVPIEVVVTKAELDGITFEEGKFVRAKLEWYRDARDCEKARVLIIEETDSVENFLAMEPGVVEHINEYKDVAHIRTEHRDTVYLREASANAVKIYTDVKVSYTRYNGPNYSRKTAIHKIEILPEPELEEIKVTVRGRVTIDSRYRYYNDLNDYYNNDDEDVADYTEYSAELKYGEYSCLEGEENPVDDIKISRELVEEHSLATGVIVEGIALKCYGKHKYDTYWKLLDIVDLQYTNETDESP